MLIDSGAPQTLCDTSVARSIGILNLHSGKEVKVGGITGFGTAYEHDITLELTELKETLEVKALFVEKMGYAGLLGQQDFFFKFNVLFEQSKLTFSVAKVKNIKF